MGCKKLTYYLDQEPSTLRKNSLKVLKGNCPLQKKSGLNYYPFGMTMPGRQFNNTDYRYGAANGQEKVDEISGVGNHYTAKYWEYDPRIARRWNLDPKPTLGVSDYSVYLNSPLWNTDVLGDRPTKKQAAAMAAHVYGDKKDGVLRGGWKVSENQFGVKNESGLKSQVYERTKKGKTEYVYATAGTELVDAQDNVDLTDVASNALQVGGISAQYTLSVANASKISNELGDGIELTYTGHSLGGGQAAANAYATGRDAITFNAAGLSPASLVRYSDFSKWNGSGPGGRPQIDALITTGDPLNNIQNNSILPNVNGTRHYVKGVLGNGHSIDNFLRIYNINPSQYQIRKPPKPSRPGYRDPNPGKLKPWEPKY